MAEEWRDVVGFEGLYQVSDEGRVKSMARGILTPHPDNKGYPLVKLWARGKGYTRRIHRLVLGAFVGPRPDKHEGSHLNGDQKDNRIANLAWETSLQNIRRQTEHGTQRRGMTIPWAKLTDEIVREVRASQETGKSLARKYGVAPKVISDVRRGLSWRHVV